MRGKKEKKETIYPSDTFYDNIQQIQFTISSKQAATALRISAAPLSVPLVITFSFGQKLDQLMSGRLLGVLIVLLQSRADDCGGLVIARDLRAAAKQRERRLES